MCIASSVKCITKGSTIPLESSVCDAIDGQNPLTRKRLRGLVTCDGMHSSFFMVVGREWGSQTNYKLRTNPYWKSIHLCAYLDFVRKSSPHHRRELKTFELILRSQHRRSSNQRVKSESANQTGSRPIRSETTDPHHCWDNATHFIN